ncbi:uncharacterized protein LOC143040158 isoform X2 [Oratosquilla oratoria]|uniref:uncharacterized protein LOC143040158 isoform X2 n=1 Tax=Oratosquilla oratoria TaxID=337810 RepID=UPI003F7731B6
MPPKKIKQIRKAKGKALYERLLAKRQKEKSEVPDVARQQECEVPHVAIPTSSTSKRPLDLPLPDENPQCEESVLPVSRAVPPQEKRKATDSTEQLVGLATEFFKRPETEEDVIAKSWAFKLKKLTAEQRRFAEKIINDTLFEAEMGNLTREGVRFQTSQHWPPSPTPSTSSNSDYLGYNWQHYNPNDIRASTPLPTDVCHNSSYQQPSEKKSDNAAGYYTS